MDTYQGLTFLVAFLAVVASVAAAYFAGGAAITAVRAVEQAKTIYNDQNQAYVYADIRGSMHDAQLAVVSLKNQGPTVATEIVTRFDPPLIPDASNSTPISEWRIAALPPGAYLELSLGFAGRFMSVNNQPCSISISGQGRHGALDSLCYTIDLAAIGQTLAIHKTITHVARELAGIRESLEKHFAKGNGNGAA